MLGRQAPGGVKCVTEELDGASVTRIEICTEEAARVIGKPVGKYITVKVEPFSRSAQLIDSGGLRALQKEIASLLPRDVPVLVAGLGNPEITADSYGPKCASLVLPTRHISEELAKSAGLGRLRCVCSISAGVLGETGIESAELIAGAVKVIKPGAVVAVDALAAASKERLGCTVQLSDTGISPGSGVGNTRAKIDESVLGVPVISIGVPTVISTSALGEGARDDSALFVTPREIDLVTERASKLTALALNCALQPHLKAEDILILTA